MTVTGAYAARAEEYADLLGTVEAMAPQDRRRLETWAAGTDGPLLDLGCGPGHWTAHLTGLGHVIRGRDPVAEFVEIARRNHPGVLYELGAVEDLAGEPRRWGGILAWYSLTHLDPEQLTFAMHDLHTALRSEGRLLLGFFDGPRQESFEHAVTAAWFWPAERLAILVEDAGFEVLECERRQDPGARPHAAISARRR